MWYIPHFATGEKFRVVFDCAARFCGVSLNDLLQDPDLTNNLVGVLSRFRQEPVAFAADIKAMFHQVFVAEPDREALRFLWWPGNDMTQPPVDYAMNVFLFAWSCEVVTRHVHFKWQRINCVIDKPFSTCANKF